MIMMTGIIDYSGQAHCMEHAPSVSSYQFEVYEGDAKTCWCGRDLSIRNLTPWENEGLDQEADQEAEFGPERRVREYRPATFTTCKTCGESYPNEGPWNETVVWCEHCVAAGRHLPKREEGKVYKGSIVRVPAGVGVVTDIDSAYGAALVKFYAVPVQGDDLDTSHGRWEAMDDMTILGFDPEALVFWANKTIKAGELTQA